MKYNSQENHPNEPVEKISFGSYSNFKHFTLNFVVCREAFVWKSIFIVL